MFVLQKEGSQLKAKGQPCLGLTINSGIFARVSFRETSHMRSFVKIKPLRSGEITAVY